MNLTYIRYLNGKGSVDGVEFDGIFDVSELLGEHDVAGDFTSHLHTADSAIELSVKLNNKVLELENATHELYKTIDLLNQTILRNEDKL